MNTNEHESEASRKHERIERILYAFYTALPWVHFFLVAILITSDFRPSSYFFFEVSTNYAAAYGEKPEAMRSIKLLGSSIETSNRFLTTLNVFMLVSLPLNFLFCYYSRKVIEKADLSERNVPS